MFPIRQAICLVMTLNLRKMESSVVAVRHYKTAGVCWYYARTYVCYDVRRHRLHGGNDVYLDGIGVF